MEITKAKWTTDGDTFNIGMPLTKIDKENRIVSGWASLDNDDLQNDRVTAAASEAAFEKFKGNIREMHQPVAVGRMVSYRPSSYYDPESKREYKGIWVDAYVSKGAPTTWEKVLDGTLAAFSIKGPIKDYEYEMRKSDGKSVRVVKSYDLEELSLVDSGGNQLANIMSVQKVNGDFVVKGIDTQFNSESVFYCSQDSVAKTSNEESVECPQGHKMERIGWIEYDDDASKSTQIDEVLAKYTAKQEVPATTEGGVDVAKENEENKETVAGSTAPAENGVEEAGKAESEENASVEKAAEVQEVTEEPKGAEEADAEKAALVSEVEAENDEPDFAKTIDGFKTDVLAVLEKNSTDAKAANEETKAVLEKAVTSFNEKVEALSKGYEELTKKFDGIETELKSVEKSLAAVESETVTKNSGDLGGSTEQTLEKSKGSSKWSGSFLGLSTLQND